MSDPNEIGLPEALERAASALPALADAIRPANGDPDRLARELSGADAPRLLAWLLEHEPAAGGELALAWAEDPDAAPALLALSPDALPKPARKALRRALHRLRSRGVAVPAAARAATVAKLAAMDDRVEEARITGLDPHGVRIAYLATDHPAGGVRLFELALEEGAGVLQCDVFETGRSRARRFLRDAERRPRWPAVPVAPGSLRALIARVATRQSADRTPPRAFAEWRSRLCDAPPDVPTPGAAARAALEPDADLEAVAAQVREGALGPWPPPIERLHPLIERLGEIAEGRVIASEAARAEQVEAAFEDAIDAVYDEAFGARTADRLDESAYVAWRQAREADARRLLAAADAFRAGGAERRGIARAMLGRLLAPAEERARRGAAAEAAAEAPAAPAADPAASPLLRAEP